MKKFIVLYHAPAKAMQETANSTPEEMKKGMEQWMQWAQKCGDKLVDMGTPLEGGQKLNASGSSEPSKKEVVGYSILQANDMNEAKSLLQGHPHLMWRNDCEIEVHESMPLPG